MERKQKLNIKKSQDDDRSDIMLSIILTLKLTFMDMHNAYATTNHFKCF